MSIPFVVVRIRKCIHEKSVGNRIPYEITSFFSLETFAPHQVLLLDIFIQFTLIS